MSAARDYEPLPAILTDGDWAVAFEIYGADDSAALSQAGEAFEVTFAPLGQRKPAAGDVHKFVAADGVFSIAAEIVTLALAADEFDAWSSGVYGVELLRVTGAVREPIYLGTVTVARGLSQLAQLGGGGALPGQASPGVRIYTEASTVRVLRGEAAGSAAAAAASAANAASAATAASSEASAAHSDRLQADADASATAADRIVVAADRVATHADAVATAADRVQTGLDRAQVATDAAAAHSDRLAADAAATSAAASYDLFDDRFLGAKAADPTVDNDGNPLAVGALYYSTVSSALKVWGGSAWSLAAPNMLDLASGTDPAKGAALVGYEGSTLKERADMALRIENPHAMRDFYAALSALDQSEDVTLCVASYGDSVSADVAMAFADFWAQQLGFMNSTSFTASELGAPMSTPTGVEAAARYPGSAPSYALAGGATYDKYADGVTNSPTYTPLGDQRWTIPAGGSVVFGNGLTIGYRRALLFLARIVGGGTATVDLLDSANNVISTQVVSAANATIDAVSADFTALDTSLGYKLRVTASGGTVICLGSAFLFRRGVTSLNWRWGGSTFNQQAQSSSAIFKFITDALGASIIFAEAKGETSTDGVVGGLDGLDLACNRFDTISASKVLIGSRPDTSTEASQLDQNWRFRARAVARDYVYVDGYDLLKNYAELSRLGWNKRNSVVETTHLPLVTAYYVASYLVDLTPWRLIRNLWNTKKVYTPKVDAQNYYLIDQQFPNDETRAFRVIYNYGLNVPLAQLENLARLKIKNPFSAAICTVEMFGSQLGFDKGLRPTDIEVTAQPTATSAFAGAATALPATPEGYIRMMVNGTMRRIPYFKDS